MEVVLLALAPGRQPKKRSYGYFFLMFLVAAFNRLSTGYLLRMKFTLLFTSLRAAMTLKSSHNVLTRALVRDLTT